MVASLDASGQVVGKPRAAARRRLGHARRPSRSVRTATVCAWPSIRSDRDDVTIDAVDDRGRRDARQAWPLLDLDAPPSFDVALALSGDAIFFDDMGAAPSRPPRAAGGLVSWSR